MKKTFINLSTALLNLQVTLSFLKFFRAKEQGVSNRVKFMIADATNLPFEDFIYLDVENLIDAYSQEMLKKEHLQNFDRAEKKKIEKRIKYFMTLFVL